MGQEGGRSCVLPPVRVETGLYIHTILFFFSMLISAVLISHANDLT